MIVEELPMKEIPGMSYPVNDLLYEFPAETWLTVYRRLDIELQLVEQEYSQRRVMTRRVEVFFLLEE